MSRELLFNVLTQHHSTQCIVIKFNLKNANDQPQTAYSIPAPIRSANAINITATTF